MYCLDCNGDAFCFYCRSSKHKDHQVIQVGFGWCTHKHHLSQVLPYPTSSNYHSMPQHNKYIYVCVCVKYEKYSAVFDITLLNFMLKWMDHR